MWKKYRLSGVFKQLHIEHITIQIFKKIEETPSGNFTVYIKLRTGASPSKVEKKLEQIAVGMKMESVSLERVSRNKFKLVFRNSSQDSFPQYPQPSIGLRNGNKVMAIPFGLNSDGYQMRLPIFTPSGGTVTLIGGLPGQGKSSALKLLVSGVTTSSDCIIWFDPKSGADASAYHNRVHAVVDPLNSEPYQRIIKFLLKSVLIRNSILSSGSSIDSLPRIILLIDEWYLLSSIAPKNEQVEIQNSLRRLVATGRSANISIILSTQRPTSQNIDVTTRELCNSRVAFYCGDIHASEAILGQPGAEDKTNPLKPGEALVWIDGKLNRTTLFRVPDVTQIPQLISHRRNISLIQLRNEEKELCDRLGLEIKSEEDFQMM